MDEDIISIWASAFIPAAEFRFAFSGGPDPFALWKGDGRPAGRIFGSSRVAHYCEINLNHFRNFDLRNEAIGGTSGVTYRPFRIFPLRKKTTDVTRPRRATIDKRGNSHFVSISAIARNPLEPLAPYLSYEYAIMIDTEAQTLRVTGKHSQFPAFDLMVGNRLIYSYLPKPGPISGTPISLYLPPVAVSFNTPLE